jgi:GNAT superfamily N-acetyltransferase
MSARRWRLTMAESKRLHSVNMRSVEPEDAERLAGLCDQLGYPCSVAQAGRRAAEIGDKEDHALIVAEIDRGRIIGWIHIYICSPLVDDRRAEIWGLVVDEKHRKAGLGRMLMNRAEAWARLKGCNSVYLRSNVVRDSAHQFYENLGYDRVKTQHVFRKEIRPDLETD